ncbi:hypothetical protein KAI92_02680 [Candidatus Parcubacteria bacterium]|nr:hypothetical protein [Candidatus Parcubacteria bacterium]
MFSKNQKNNKLEQEEIKIDDKVVIYTMPKHSNKFSSLNSSNKASSSQNSKKAGIMIFIIGGIVLIGLFAFLYFVVLGKSISGIVKDDGEKIIVAKNDTEEDIKKDDLTKKINDDIVDNDKLDIPIDPEKNNDEDENDKKVIISKIIIPEEAVDTDRDGLSDSEEILLTTNPNLFDTDKDDYNDLDEILSGYDPAGEGKLLDNPNVDEYKDKKYNFSFYYPISWIIEHVSGGDTLMIKEKNNQMFMVSVSLNVNNLSLDEWYKKQFNVNEIDIRQYIVVKDWKGIKSEDDLFVYFIYGNNIYNISYNLGDVDKVPRYKNIFNMMVGSFSFK